MTTMDGFALPGAGTETRGNAQAAVCESMATDRDSAKQVAALQMQLASSIAALAEAAGFLRLLSVLRSSTRSQSQEPLAAVAVDPTRTMSAGKGKLGAFRTYPNLLRHWPISLNKREDSVCTASDIMPQKSHTSKPLWIANRLSFCGINTG